jgi:hypothetical protein
MFFDTLRIHRRKDTIMNLLYYKWNGYMQNDLIAHLRQLGHSVDVIQYVFHSDRVSDTDTFLKKNFIGFCRADRLTR